MKKKKLLCGLGSTALLLMLAGCGFKLDDQMLSKNGGIWKSSSGEILKFSDNGNVTLYDSSKKETGSGSYSVSESDDSYTLKMNVKDSTVGVVSGNYTVEVPKKDQSNKKFSGTVKGSVGLGSYQTEDQDGGTVTYEKESSDYLD